MCQQGNNYFAHIPPHSSLGEWGQKVKTLFRNMVMFHIELKGMEHRAPYKHIFCAYIYPLPLWWGQRSKHFFSENSHVANQIKGKEV